MGKAWGRKGMLSTGLIAIFNGPANVIGDVLKYKRSFIKLFYTKLYFFCFCFTM